MSGLSALPRRWRFAAVTSTSWLAAPVALALEIVNYLDRGRPWRDDFFWAVDWAGTAIFLIVPVLAGLVAADAATLMGPGRRGLTTSSPREGAALLRPAGIGLAGAGVVHLAFLGVYAASASPRSDRLGQALLMVLAQAVVLAVFAVLGALLGASLGMPWAPVVAVVASPAVMWVLGRDSGVFSPFNVGGSTSSLVGLTTNPRFILVQLFSLALAFAVVVWAVRHRWPWTSRGARLPGLALILLAFGVLALQRVPDLDRLEVVSSPPRLECSGASPTVCLFPEHQRFAGDVRANLDRLYGSVPRSVAERLPARLEERYPSGPVPSTPGVAAFEVLPDSFTSDSIALTDTASSLVTPWGCREIFDRTAPGERYFAASQQLVRELVRSGRGSVQWTPAQVQGFLGLYDEVKSCRIFR